jgi:hypothetical protein
MCLRFLPLAAAVVLVPAGTAFGQDDVRAVLEKAIKAQGGAEKLKKFKAARIKTKGKIQVGGGIEITQEISYLLPDKLREEVNLEVDGKHITQVVIINGSKFAVEVNGKKIPLPDKVKDSIKDVGHLLRVARLVALRDKAYNLAPLGEVKVNGKPAVGIRVGKKGHPDINLYFYKKTGLMAKLEHRAVDPLTGQEATEERIIAEYMESDGMPMPRRVTMRRDGKLFLEAEVLEARFLESLDESEFAVP